MSNSSSSSAQSGGIGILGLLGVVFVTLKLLNITAVADWSWWWVTAPFWGGIALFLALALVVGILSIIISMMK